MPDPIYEDLITLPASCFDKETALLGYDKGCSLTKVLVGKRDDDVVHFTCRTYKNSDIDAALDWMAANADIAASSQVKITGVGGDLLRPQIEERLMCRVAFVDEFKTQQKGAELLLQHMSEADVFYPNPKVLSDSRTRSKMSQKGGDTDEVFPTMFMYIGSGTGITCIGGGTGSIVGGSCIGGKALIGLANLLLGTNNFNEINDLAMKGDWTKAAMISTTHSDTTKDFDCESDTNEGDILHFGKLSEALTNKENFSREDKAAALLGLFAEVFLNFIYIRSKSFGVKRIVIGGNLVRSECFREYCFARHQAKSSSLNGTELKFLRIGHTAAFGTLLVECKTE